MKTIRTILMLCFFLAANVWGQGGMPQSASANQALAPGALVISGISVDQVTPFSAVITWTTNNPSDSLVEFGPTAAYGRHVSSTSQTLSHKIVLTSLAGGSLYHFRITSQAGSEKATSEDRTFNTASSHVMFQKDGS